MVGSMDRWVGKVAVVTGASSGIGAGIAESLVEQGLKVVGLARRKERIEELAKKLSGKKGKLYALKTDISKEEDILATFKCPDSLDKLLPVGRVNKAGDQVTSKPNWYKWIKDNVGPVNILINNAGISRETSLSDGKTEAWEDIIRVNVMGLCIATREAIRDMKANNIDGHIVHINSIVGHQVINFPDMNVYSASKFAVRALAETLRLELNSSKSKIKITDLSPGVVLSEFGRQHMTEQLKEMVQTMIKEKQILYPEDIADAVTYVLSTPPHVQIQELIIRGVIELF